MDISRHPIRATLIFGLLSGFSAVPLIITLAYLTDYSRAICLTLWSFVSLYGILLGRWSRKSFLLLVFPFIILLLSVFWIDSISNYFLFALAILGWIRSGICFQEYPAGRVAVELAISLGAGLLVSCFTPYSVFGWAMGIWMFFLVQTLFFIIFDRIDPVAEYKLEIDPFERARRKVENILTTAPQGPVL